MAQGATERSLEKPNKNLVLSTLAFEKPKTVLVQSKLAFQIVMTIHTEKKQFTSDYENTDTYDAIPEPIRDIGKKIHPTRTAKDKNKQEKKVQHRSRVSS